MPLVARYLTLYQALTYRALSATLTHSGPRFGTFRSGRRRVKRASLRRFVATWTSVTLRGPRARTVRVARRPRPAMRARSTRGAGLAARLAPTASGALRATGP